MAAEDGPTGTPVDAPDPPITFEGRTLDVILRRRHAELTRHVITGITGALPHYADLPAEAVEDDLTAAFDRAIRLYLTVLADDREPTGDELAQIADSAAERSEEGFTVDLVLGAYLLGVQLVMEALVSEVHHTDATEVIRASARSMAFLRTVTSTILRQAGGDSQALKDLRLQTDHELLLALLAGAVDDALLARTGRRLSPAHLVLRFTAGPHPDESAAGTAGSIASRRKLRRLRDQLLAEVGHDVLSSVSAAGGVVVIGADDNLGDDELRTRLAPVVAALADAAGADVHAAAASVPSERTADAGDLTAEVLHLARRIGRPPGLHLLSDVAHEYQLTRPGPARRLLAATLAPLAPHPSLLETLRAYLDADGNRRRTALDLGVHPNTVDHRMRRVTGLIGVPFDAVRLSASLLALDAETAEHGHPPDDV